MNLTELTEVTATLAKVTDKLAKMAAIMEKERLDVVYPLIGELDINALEIEMDKLCNQKLEPVPLQDLVITHNLDLIPPVVPEEKDEVAEYIEKHDLQFNAAKGWFITMFGMTALKIIDGGFISEEHLLRRYAMEKMKPAK